VLAMVVVFVLALGRSARRNGRGRFIAIERLAATRLILGMLRGGRGRSASAGSSKLPPSPPSLRPRARRDCRVSTDVLSAGTVQVRVAVSRDVAGDGAVTDAKSVSLSAALEPGSGCNTTSIRSSAPAMLMRSRFKASSPT
jgi:hypothetical protein